MSNGGINVIDTKSFVAVMDTRAELVSEYDRIIKEYDRIIATLLNNWDGKGADAFKADATVVGKNIGGINDVLKIMSDTLVDCLEVIKDADRQIGDANREPPPESNA